MSGIRPFTVAFGAGVVLLSAGCGAVDPVTGAKATPSPTPAANGVVDKPPGEILRLATRAFQDAGSVHLKGNGTSNGELYAVDVRIKGGKGTITVNHNLVEMVRIGADAYFKGDADFWKDVTGDAEMAVLLKGRYLKVRSDEPDLKSILMFTDTDVLASTMLRSEGVATKGERRTIQGVETIGVMFRSGKDSTTLYVATTGRPYPMQLISASDTADSGALDFFDYDRPFELRPPPADLVVDTSKPGK